MTYLLVVEYIQSLARRHPVLQLLDLFPPLMQQELRKARALLVSSIPQYTPTHLLLLMILRPATSTVLGMMARVVPRGFMLHRDGIPQLGLDPLTMAKWPVSS